MHMMGICYMINWICCFREKYEAGEQRRRGIWVSSCLFLYSLNLLQWELIEEELTADKKKKIGEINQFGHTIEGHEAFIISTNGAWKMIVF